MEVTATNLDRYLSRQKQVSNASGTWGEIGLQITGYLTGEPPPWELVSSVRAVVLKKDAVLVMRNVDSTHILPGGRVEEGENHEEALKREIFEEAGVEIEAGDQIGLVHLTHTTPKPKDYPYPYPDFLWPVYVASFRGLSPEAKVEDDYEISSRFLPIKEARALVADGEKIFLDDTVARRF